MQKKYGIIAFILLICVLLMWSGARTFNITISKVNLKELQSNYTQLEKQQETLQKKYDDLQKTLDDTQTKYNTLQTNFNDLQTQKEELEQEKKTALANRKTAYLTFDDGPSQNTPTILDILKQNDIHATFFVNGHDTDFAKDMYKSIVDNGNAIGNHTYSHDYATLYQSEDGFFQDFNKLQNLLQDTIGFKPDLVRFPGGSNNTVSYHYGGKGITTAIAKDLIKDGYQYFDWNVDSTDASTAVQNKDEIIRQVLNQSQGHQKIVVLMHDAPEKTTTPEALPAIIEGLKEQGFSFSALSKDAVDIRFLRPN